MLIWYQTKDTGESGQPGHRVTTQIWLTLPSGKQELTLWEQERDGLSEFNIIKANETDFFIKHLNKITA